MKKVRKYHGKVGDVFICATTNPYVNAWTSRTETSDDCYRQVSKDELVVRLPGRIFLDEMNVLHPVHGPIWIRIENLIRL